MKRSWNPASALFIWAVRGYQTFLSPMLPGSCKYYPSCSQYAIDALKQYGAMRGLVLAAWRLLRCNPLSYGGYDPVERQKLFAPRPCVQPTHGGLGRCAVSAQGSSSSSGGSGAPC